jgi:hypothetical protein
MINKIIERLSHFESGEICETINVYWKHDISMNTTDILTWNAQSSRVGALDPINQRI